MTVSFSGLGSGNDWSSVITQLVALERQPITVLQKKKSDAQRQLSVVGDLVSRLGSLASKAKAMQSATNLWGVTTSSSDDRTVKATATGSGTAGTFAVRVSQLAMGEARQSRAFISAAAGVAGDGTFSLKVGAGAAVDIAYTSSDTLSDLAARISASGAGVSAAAIYDGTSYRLVLSSQSTGTENALTITDPGDALGWNLSGNTTQAACDAIFKVNGATVQKPGNVVTDVIAGVSLELRGKTADGAADVIIGTARDPSSLKTKIKDLVGSYNDVAKLLSSQLAYGGTQRGEESLFGDPVATGLSRRLGSTIATGFTHGATTISMRGLGISLASDGTLSIDEAKLDAALSSDPGAASDLLSGSAGLASALAALADEHTSATGPLVTRQATLNSRMTGADKDIAKVESHATATEERLRKQFQSLDSIMATYNTQLAYLNRIT